MTREEAIHGWVLPAIKNTWNEKKCEEILKALEQEPKTGHWKTVPEEETLYCSECNLRLDDEQTYMPLHYCPNCGAKMESEDKE